MNEKPIAGELNSDGMPAKAGKSPFMRVLAAGVIGWVLGFLLLFGLSWGLAHPVSVPAAVVWTISHSWTAFLFGALVLAGYGLKAGIPIGHAACAYVLPVAVLALIAWVCLLVYPDYSLREELFTYLPMVLLFYGLALLWVGMSRNGSEKDSFARAVIPAILGGAVILGFVTVPVFGSDAFRYRNTFDLKIFKTETRDGKFVAEGTLEIREPGNYTFTAPRYIWAPASEESTMEAGVITWGAAGAPKTDAPGVYPMVITWAKALQAGTDYGYDIYEDSINIEVRHPEEGDKVIYFLSAPLEAAP